MVGVPVGGQSDRRFRGVLGQYGGGNRYLEEVEVEVFVRDTVVYDRARTEDGLRKVALSQCVADLLTGGGRGPAEADALLGWMARNEDAWRS